MKYCPNCNAEVAEEQKYCIYCGENLQPKTPEQNNLASVASGLQPENPPQTVAVIEGEPASQIPVGFVQDLNSGLYFKTERKGVSQNGLATDQVTFFDPITKTYQQGVYPTNTLEVKKKKAFLAWMIILGVFLLDMALLIIWLVLWHKPQSTMQADSKQPYYYSDWRVESPGSGKDETTETLPTKGVMRPFADPPEEPQYLEYTSYDLPQLKERAGAIYYLGYTSENAEDVQAALNLGEPKHNVLYRISNSRNPQTIEPILKISMGSIVDFEVIGSTVFYEISDYTKTSGFVYEYFALDLETREITPLFEGSKGFMMTDGAYFYLADIFSPSSNIGTVQTFITQYGQEWLPEKIFFADSLTIPSLLLKQKATIKEGSYIAQDYTPTGDNKAVLVLINLITNKKEKLATYDESLIKAYYIRDSLYSQTSWPSLDSIEGSVDELTFSSFVRNPSDKSRITVTHVPSGRVDTIVAEGIMGMLPLHYWNDTLYFSEGNVIVAVPVNNLEAKKEVFTITDQEVLGSAGKFVYFGNNTALNLSSGELQEYQPVGNSATVAPATNPTTNTEETQEPGVDIFEVLAYIAAEIPEETLSAELQSANGYALADLQSPYLRAVLEYKPLAKELVAADGKVDVDKLVDLFIVFMKADDTTAYMLPEQLMNGEIAGFVIQNGAVYLDESWTPRKEIQAVATLKETSIDVANIRKMRVDFTDGSSRTIQILYNKVPLSEDGEQSYSLPFKAASVKASLFDVEPDR